MHPAERHGDGVCRLLPAQSQALPADRHGRARRPSLPDLGDIDIRTDVPRYRVFKDGKLVDEPADIASTGRTISSPS